MNFVTVDLANYIAEQLPELGKVDRDIFYDYVPPKGDNIVVFLEYTGSAVVDFTKTSVRSVQCYVRADSHTRALETAWKVYKAIHTESLIKKLGNVMAIISMRDTPFRLKMDDKGNTIYVFNMGITYNYE